MSVGTELTDVRGPTAATKRSGRGCPRHAPVKPLCDRAADRNAAIRIAGTRRSSMVAHETPAANSQPMG
jgi:hypothetical protein